MVLDCACAYNPFYTAVVAEIGGVKYDLGCEDAALWSPEMFSEDTCHGELAENCSLQCYYATAIEEFCYGESIHYDRSMLPFHYGLPVYSKFKCVNEANWWQCNKYANTVEDCLANEDWASKCSARCAYRMKDEKDLLEWKIKQPDCKDKNVPQYDVSTCCDKPEYEGCENPQCDALGTVGDKVRFRCARTCSEKVGQSILSKAGCTLYCPAQADTTLPPEDGDGEFELVEIKPEEPATRRLRM